MCLEASVKFFCFDCCVIRTISFSGLPKVANQTMFVVVVAVVSPLVCA